MRKFEELNIIVSGDDIDSWFAADGPGNKHLDENGIVELINSEDAGYNDEEEDNSEADIAPPCTVSKAEAMSMFDKCLTWLRHQPQATVANNSTLAFLRELAAERREASQRQSDIRSLFSKN